MCGILAYICRGTAEGSSQECEGVKQLLTNRGPDATGCIEVSLINEWNGYFLANVLWTQGPQLSAQPLVNHDGSILLWNGDLYSEDRENVSDTEWVLSQLAEHGVDSLTRICGPYSFIYYDKPREELWFGRDILGRHSLLWDVDSESVLLTSVGNLPTLQGKRTNVTELPSWGFFKIDLSKDTLNVKLMRWFHINIDEIFLINCVDLPGADVISHELLKFQSFNREPNNSELLFLENIPTDSPKSMLSALSKEVLFLEPLHKLKELLYKSVKRRTVTKPNYCKNCLILRKECDHPKVGVLFSGGLDSAILTLIANEFVPKEEPIDLFNVAFERGSNRRYDSVPDRKTGRATLEELNKLCPDRTWNFIEINISQKEVCLERERRIRDLIYPLKSILDDSLGCALWFAARGQGLLHTQPYTSPARVVLLGMGADEMFGGYSKHRKAFSEKGWPGLGRVLTSEVTSIGARNLGRDNRIVADHGLQPRAPYLDEKFVAYVTSLPPWNRCCLSPELPRGVGDKLLLRILAYQLGLTNAALLPKKALQFGSHIANPKEKGHDVSNNLKT